MDITSGIDDLVNIFPSEWPGKTLDVQPGDLSRFAPIDFGPWENSTELFSHSNSYGYHAQTNHPFLSAPFTEACGGTVYFGGKVKQPDIEALLRLLEVCIRSKHYAVFSKLATNPLHERYLVQIRIVSNLALHYLFHAIESNDINSMCEQPLSVGELIRKFIERQQALCGGLYHRKLDGLWGGDGDGARETLAFAFMVENATLGIYRIWSRCWLVTK